MKINEKWLDKVSEGISKKSLELKQIALANKLHKELETKPLDQVLADHLPISDPIKMKAVAEDMQHAIRRMYDGLDSQITNTQVEARLNKVLDGLECNDQGKLLVNLMNCVTAVNPEGFAENSRWQELKIAESFQQENVRELKAMVQEALDNGAGFLARQEFLVMENALEKLSHSVVEAQMNSGEKYAEAYAAAMYIITKQVYPQQEVTPHQLGLLAVESVESSRLLALYHYGKLRIEEVMPKLKALAKQMLTFAGEVILHGAALALRLGGAYLIADVTFDIMAYLAITNTAVLLVVSLGFAAAAFLGYTHEEAVADVSAIWNAVENIISKIFHFFKGNDPTSPAPSAAVIAVDDEIEQVAVNTDAQYVTI